MIRYLMLAVLLLAAACTPSPVDPAVTSTITQPVEAPDHTPVPPTPTLEPPRVLTVCLGREPSSLFVYSDSSSAARAVRQAIYDGPVDVQGYAVKPVIFTQLPGLANGGVRVETVTVQTGDALVDAQGELVTLQPGVVYFPSGCSDASCSLTYSGADPVQMDQQVTRFQLKPGLSWADGAPLTADDSVYSYEIARALFPRVRSALLVQTASYQAVDETTVEWRGLPGYRDPRSFQNFFVPLPRHAWGAMPAEDLLTQDLVNRQPLGWGPYQVSEWTVGDHITLVPNPAYFRSAEGLPHFDRLVFRFPGSPQAALDALQAGECDYLEESTGLENSLPRVLELQQAGAIKVEVVAGTGWEGLVFNLQPVSSDPTLPPPASLFASAEVRRGIAACIDRESIAHNLWSDLSAPALGYMPSGHPLANPEAEPVAYDPQAALEQLQVAGWTDADGDPATPLTSTGVPGIPDGTPLAFTLLTGDEAGNTTALQIQENLNRCGIQVEVQSLPWQELVAPGPDGPVFGRKFQAALIGWTAGLEPPCSLYTTAEIPGPFPEHPKGWGGANAGGWSLAEFDQACQKAASTLPEDLAYAEAHRQAQSVFTQEMPVIPLYERVEVAAMRPDLCGADFDASYESSLQGLESFDYGEACQP